MVWGGKIWGDGGMFCSAVKRLGEGETFIVQEGKDDMTKPLGPECVLDRAAKSAA